MNILPVMRELISNQRDFKFNHSLPVVVESGQPLEFREYKWGDNLVKSHLFSVMEPSADKQKVYPQVMIVPLMGFQNDCHRIGYGGGFYDRSIEQMKEIYKGKILMIGVAFEAQKFDLFKKSAAESDIWRENQCSKIERMRLKFENNQNIKWVQLDTDQPLDYIVTEKQIYKKD
uniref:5-formyltetrahydrofolate cyclo-ligase n=1 Tax=Strombidium rassoulzadegani TaxID=1082188 RepID=A0A7S3CLG2_9SPIT|mmetsp:Transcript_12746/g.21494  ORF Transcript_12746/g.21494 Transcript_12746/m.21494 type:complete len:174 (+) Transcript_12746:493-1014(+)|eukprot:CAMPEP_0168621808 /NCGR_PEP_ID=MMETSP0449_2-20121227/7906_1 /TAXON_ID=1082188 /ORGANISM="Strombidium rassoulzadegani, Strain ras09" /LENGTH=173 /DNA_ID=CAMNT_0008662981 /DNA_START=408 /DNA_END=929 /DNA_ORIENTATION=+